MVYIAVFEWNMVDVRTVRMALRYAACSTNPIYLDILI
jgi:hypothetical protein